MKIGIRYIITLLISGFCCGLAHAEDIQRIAGSETNEGKSMDKGGKVLEDTIYVPASGGEVTLYTHSSSNQYRPMIKWLSSDKTVLKSGKCGNLTENGSNKTVCDASSYNLTLANGYAAPYVVYAVSYPATGTNETTSDDVVDYTKKFVIMNPVNFASCYSHRLVAPAGARIRLVPKDVRIGNYFINGKQATNFKFKLPDGNFVDPNYGGESEYKVAGKTTNGDYPFDYAYSTRAPQNNVPVKYECYAYNGTESLKIEEWVVSVQQMPELALDTLYFNGFETYTTQTGTSIKTGLGKNSFTGEWTSDYAVNSNIVGLPTRSEYGLFTGSGPRSIGVCSGKYSVFMDVVSLPDRLFHFVADGIFPGDSLFVSGFFRTRPLAGDSCNLRFVVYDYTNNKKGNEIVTYNTGTIGADMYKQYGVSLTVPSNCNRILVEIVNNTFSQSDNNDLGIDNLSVRRLSNFPKDGVYKIKNVRTGHYLINDMNGTQSAVQKDGSALWYLKDSLRSGKLYMLNLDVKTSDRLYLSLENNTVTLAAQPFLISGSMRGRAATGDTVVFALKDNGGSLSVDADSWILEPDSLFLKPGITSITSSALEQKIKLTPVSSSVGKFSSPPEISISGQLTNAYENVGVGYSETDGPYLSFAPITVGTYTYNVMNSEYSKGGAVPVEYCRSQQYRLEVTTQGLDGIYKIQNRNTGRFLRNSPDSTSYNMKTDGTTLWYLSTANNENYLLNLDTTSGVVRYLYVEGGTVKFSTNTVPIPIKSSESKYYSLPFKDVAARLAYSSADSYEWILTPVSLSQYTNTFKVFTYGMDGSVNIPIYRKNECVRIANPEKLQLNLTSITGSSANCTVEKSDAGLYIKVDNLKGYSNLVYNFTNLAYSKGGLVPAAYRTSESYHTIVSMNVASGDWFHLYFNRDSKVLDVKREDDRLMLVLSEEDDRRETQNWQIRMVGSDLYTIVNANGMVLTGTESGDVQLKPYSGSSSQVWRAITSTNADEVGYLLINEGTKTALTRYGDYTILASQSSTYDANQRLVATISDYIYTIRIPQGNKGFNVNFHDKSGVDNVRVWIDDEKTGFSSYNFDCKIDVSSLSKNGALPVPNLNGFISGLKEGVYDFKMETRSDDGHSCPNVYPFRLKVLPSKLIWTGGDDQDATNWNDDGNWTSEAGTSQVPIALSSVVIPAGLTSYPILQDSIYYLDAANVPFRDQNFSIRPSVDTLYVKHGGELARTDFLKYNVAKYNVDSLQTNRWYGMTAPLKCVYSGDYAFRKVNPLLFMREHNMPNPDDEADPGIDWTNSFRTATENVSGIGFAVNVSPLYYYGMTWASADAIDYAKRGNLCQMQNLADYGVSMEFPATNMSFQFYDSNTKHPMETVQSLQTGNRSKAGRFVYENGNDEVELTDGAIYKIDVQSNVTEGSFILVSNPFLSHLDFTKFYEENSSFIANGYKILDGMEPSYSTFMNEEDGGYQNGLTSASGNIAPLQSFIVTSLGAGSFPLKFTPDMSITDPVTPRLRSSYPLLSNRILITAKDAYNTTNAVLMLDGWSSVDYDVTEDSKCLFVESSKAPTIAIISGSHYLDVSREPKLRESTPLALMALGTGSVDLEVRGAMSLLENGDKLYFIDKKNAVMDEIDSDDYSYTVTSDGTTILNRFFLMFKSAFSSSEDLVQDETCSIQLYRDGDGASIVSQNAPIRKVIVYLPNGAVYSVVKDLNCDFITVPLPSESKIVLVKVVTDEETKTFKVFR